VTEGSTDIQDETASESPDDGVESATDGATAGATVGETEALAEATRKKAERRKDLLKRLASSAVLIPFVLWTIAQGGLFYLGVVIVIGLLAQHEFYGLIVDKGAKPLHSVGLAFGTAVILVAYFGNEYQAMLLMTATLLVLMVAQLGKNEIHEAMASISGTFFGVVYVGWLMSHAVALRQFDHAVSAHHGPDALLQLGITPDSGIFFMVTRPPSS